MSHDNAAEDQVAYLDEDQAIAYLMSANNLTQAQARAQLTEIEDEAGVSDAALLFAYGMTQGEILTALTTGGPAIDVNRFTIIEDVDAWTIAPGPIPADEREDDDVAVSLGPTRVATANLDGDGLLMIHIQVLSSVVPVGDLTLFQPRLGIRLTPRLRTGTTWAELDEIVVLPADHGTSYPTPEAALVATQTMVGEVSFLLVLAACVDEPVISGAVAVVDRMADVR